jgi:hypothetical protein
MFGGDDDLPINSLSREWKVARLMCGQRWRRVASLLNAEFDIAIDSETWRSVLHWRHHRTVGELCDLIAAHAKVRVVMPVTVMGSTSAAAGAFLAVRAVLRDAGANVSELRPTSPLAPYLDRCPGPLGRELRRMAPGNLPPIYLYAPLQAACAIGVLLSGAMFLVGLWLRIPRWNPFAALITEFVFLAMAWIGHRLSPPRVRFAGVKDFRDLCRVIVGERCTTGPGFPVVLKTQS